METNFFKKYNFLIEKEMNEQRELFGTYMEKFLNSDTLNDDYSST